MCAHAGSNVCLLSLSATMTAVLFLFLLFFSCIQHERKMSRRSVKVYVVSEHLNMFYDQAVDHGRRSFKDPNPSMSSLLVIFVWGGVAIL